MRTVIHMQGSPLNVDVDGPDAECLYVGTQWEGLFLKVEPGQWRALSEDLRRSADMASTIADKLERTAKATTETVPIVEVDDHTTGNEATR